MIEFNKQTVLFSNFKGTFHVVVGTKRNHNGLHLKVMNLHDGFVGHFNNVESEYSRNILKVITGGIDGYQSRNNVEDWILSKMELLLTQTY